MSKSSTIGEDIRKVLPNIITGETYPVTAIIVKKREGEDRYVEDKARRITTDEGLQKYELKNEGVETKPVQYDKIHNVGGEDRVYIRSPNKGIYNAFSLGEWREDGGFDEEEANWENWRHVTAMNERQDWKEPGSWLEENKEIVAFGIIGLGVLLSQVGSAYYISSTLEGMQPLADAFARAAETLAQTQTGGG